MLGVKIQVELNSYKKYQLAAHEVKTRLDFFVN